MTTSPFLAVDRARIAYGSLVAVHDVSITVARGATAGLVGESGSGKTSLGKALACLIELAGGAIRFEGADLHTLAAADRLALRRRLQIMFQDPVSSLSPRLTVRTLLAEPIRVHGLPFAESWRRVEALMVRLGLAFDLLDKYPHQVSGGQARRIAIVRALVLNPALVVCDEPTAGLDVSVQGELLNLMRDLQTEHALTYVIISHNLTVIRRVTDLVAVMYLGEIVETGPTDPVFAAPAHPYTAALIAATPAIDPAKRRTPIVLPGEIPSPRDPPPGCRFHPRCPQAQARCRREPPTPRAIGDGRTVACHFPLV
jgi:peptide/nickel transport system ATP-binding protein